MSYIDERRGGGFELGRIRAIRTYSVSKRGDVWSFGFSWTSRERIRRVQKI